MPKNILKINRFEGGINNNADPKDIDKTEVADAVDAYFGKTGQVSTLGRAVSANDINPVGDVNIEAGYGLANFQTGHSTTEGGGGTSYTSWSAPSITEATNGIDPNFTISLSNMTPHHMSHIDPSSEATEYAQESLNETMIPGFHPDTISCKNNWGFRIHIGSDPYGTPDISYPISTDSTQEVTFTPKETSAKTFTYNILTANDDSGVSRKWIKMLPDNLHSLTNLNTNESIASITNRYFFSLGNRDGDYVPQYPGSNHSLKWATASDPMEGVSPPTGLSYNGQSNMLLTIAAIMSQESNTTVNLWGDDDNFTHMNVYINAEEFGQDYTPSNKYMWVEYRHYSQSQYSNNSQGHPNFRITDIASMHENRFLAAEAHGFFNDQYDDVGSRHVMGAQDFNFLTIPQRLDSDHWLKDKTSVSDGSHQIFTDFPNNNFVPNLLSEGFVYTFISGGVQQYTATTQSVHSERRIKAGIDATQFSWQATLQESDGGDNAVSGETYAVDITGPNIDNTFTASQAYAAMGNDELTEIAATLATAITPAYGSELVTNGAFGADTDWTKGGGWAISGGAAVCTSLNNSLQQTLALDVSTYYKVEVDVTITSGTLFIDLGDSSGGNVQSTSISSSSQVFIFKTPSSHPSGDELIRFYGGSFVGFIDDVSVKECTSGVPGLTASVPSGANLLVQTTGYGQAFPYQLEPYVIKNTGHAYAEKRTEILTLIDSNSDMHVCDTSIGVWSNLFNNGNAHQIITGIADDTTGEPRFTVTAHGYDNGDIVSIKGTANYDGIYAVKDKTTNTFDVAATFLAETAASTMTVTKLTTTSVNSRNSLLWPNTGAKLQTYSNNGILRLSDSNFDNRQNNSAWLGYISKQNLFNQTASGTADLDIEGWFIKKQHQAFASTPTDWVDARWDEDPDTVENAGKLKIKIDSPTTTGGSWEATDYKFYITALFDDNTESLPSLSDTQGLNYKDASNFYHSVATGDAITIDVSVDPTDANGNYAFDERMQGFRIYYSKLTEGHGELYQLGTIDFKYGFVRADGGGTQAWEALGSDNNDAQITTVTMLKEYNGNTFELNTGYSPTEDALPDVRWKCATVVGNRTFVGNVRYDDGLGEKYYPSRMIGSIPTRNDCFVIPGGILEFVTNDGDEIMQLENFSDRLLQFKRNSLYIINVSTYGDEFMEEEHKWKGISNPHHVLWTPEGIIWANEYSAYIYNGKDVEDLVITDKGVFKDSRVISRDTWSDFFSANSVLIYDPEKNQLIIKRSDTGSALINSGDIYVYDIDNGSWAFGKDRFITNSATDNPKTTNAVTLADGRIYIMKSVTSSTDGKFIDIIDKTEAGVGPPNVLE